ncbi:MAG: imidazoleglycerol-phosphate dehydratase HisB [Deltaproteobacteria bacterium]|nr:imidazoleglycerol-phosphate dehydratase HisB [Deltaproteobacteria bacterium]
MDRKATVSRKTNETSVEATLRLEGSGKAEISTGIGFMDHMLTLLAVHGLLDLSVSARGDVDVDLHHTVEDVGLVLGQALAEALGDKTGIRRYGSAWVPMDEALGVAHIDVSGRPFLVFEVEFSSPAIMNFDTQLFLEFFRAFATKAGITCHLSVPYGKNDHHKIEAVFKALGRALNVAVSKDPRVAGVPSSKGAL